jgi:hypothetical protein
LLSYLRHSAGTEAKSFGTKFPVQGAEPVARKGHEASPFMERRHHVGSFSQIEWGHFEAARLLFGLPNRVPNPSD